MNNVPNNMKAFDLVQAKAGHPICTRDGREAKFIAHVPEADKLHKVVALIIPSNELLHWSEKGTHFEFETETDLFLAPLGYCEGKPVFAGDVLEIGSDRNFVAKVGQNCFEDFKWPSQKPVVETRMTEREILEKYTGCGDWPTRVANGAIARSIADGDVIPTEVVEKLMCDAYNMNYHSRDFSFKQNAEFILKQYKESLK